MKIGIVSNSAHLLLPLLSFLSGYKNKTGVTLFICNSNNSDSNIAVVTAFCRAYGFALTLEANKDDIYNWREQYKPEIIFIAGYSEVLKTSRFSMVKYGIFNIHYGFLPEFRGPSPVFWQLKKGVKEIGIAIHRLVDKLDSGLVVWKEKIKNCPHFNYDTVHQIFSELQVKGIYHIMETLNSGNTLKEENQDEDQANYYSRPELKDVAINWDQMKAGEIVDLIKACNSWNSGSITSVNGSEVKIIDAVVITINTHQYTPGTIIVNDNSIIAMCKDDKALDIKFFKLNTFLIPGRFAAAYGFKTGQCFTSL